MKKQSVIARIQNAGMKNTKYRVNILELMEKNHQLMSAQEIYQKLVAKKMRINLSTVYRSLDALVENKLLNRVTIEKEKQALYEYNRDEHHHFLICNGCNKIIPIYNCPLEDYAEEVQKETGFKVTGHRIEFYGLCEDCQKQSVDHQAGH